MKTFTSKFLMMMALILSVCISVVSVEAARKTVAVMPIENISGYSAENVAEIMTEELIVAIMSSGRFSVLERTQMDTIMREQGFQNIAADPNTAVEVGRLSGADYSIIGKVTMATVVENTNKSLANLLLKEDTGALVNSLKGKVALDVRFVNNETGELIFAKSFEGSKSGNNPASALHGACKEASERFLKEMNVAFFGRIVEIDAKQVYIDQGKDSGLRKGDTLLVVRETDPIIIGDKIVGMKTIEIGKVKITEVNDEYSVGKIDKVFKGQFIQKGDVVKRG